VALHYLIIREWGIRRFFLDSVSLVATDELDLFNTVGGRHICARAPTSTASLLPHGTQCTHQFASSRLFFHILSLLYKFIAEHHHPAR
jgi:hypothetical protein